MKSDKFPGARCPAMATRHVTTLLLGALSLAATGARAADEATPAPTEGLAEIVITGSIIQSPNQLSPSPIVITSAEDLRQSGQV